MKSDKEVRISYWAHHLTTIVSVTLVLLLMGIIALIWISADTETRRLKERLELTVIMADTVPAAQAKAVAADIGRQPYARGVRYTSRDEALRNWTADTGEDLQELFGVNPLSDEVTFGIRADYADPRAIDGIRAGLEKLPGVEAVSSPDASMVEAMNENISRLTVILAIVAGVMLVISFVLINNTVHLAIYSRRFTIHTMQLVGATNGFIRRPIIVNNMLAGLVAGLVAAAVIAVALAGSKEAGLPDLGEYIGWAAYGIVAASLVAAGMLLCALASWWSANVYLRNDYDQLFR